MVMAKSPTNNFPVIILFLSFIISTTTNVTGDHLLHSDSLLPGTTTASYSATCRGTIAECLAGGEAEEEDFLMDSEINRRILAATSHISYAALGQNYIPCSLRGASYYNCRPGGAANPYRRGCSQITRCGRGQGQI